MAEGLPEPKSIASLVSRLSGTPIERKISETESALRGATAREIRHALAPLLAVNLSGMPADWKLAQPIYAEVLSDVPLDLLREAVMTHIRTSEWFPKPAHLRSLIGDELDRRRAALADLKTQQAELQRQPDPEFVRVTADEATAIYEKYGVNRSVARRGLGLVDPVIYDEAAAKRVADGLKGFRRVPMPWLGESE